MSIFKKIYLFFVYRKNLLKSQVDLKLRFNMRIDRIYRFYTVLNIPQEYFEEPYNMRKNDIDVLSANYIRDFNDKISSYLNSKGLTELFTAYDIEKVDKYSYLVIFGFSLFNTKNLTLNLFYISIGLLALSIILLPIFIILF